MLSEESKEKAKANKFLAALATKIPLKSLSEITIVDLFENAVSSLEKGPVRKTILADLDSFFRVFEEVVKTRQESTDGGSQIKAKPRAIPVDSAESLLPLAAIRRLLRGREESSSIERTPSGYVRVIESCGPNLSGNFLAGDLMQSSSIILDVPNELATLCRLIFARLTAKREWVQQATIEAVSCLWAFCAVIAYSSSNGSQAQADQKLAEGCLLSLCSESSQFLLYSLGYVGYWGMQLYRGQYAKNKSYAFSEGVNGLLQVLLTLGATISSKAGEDVDTSDVALCLITCKSWIAIAGINSDVAEKMKSFLHTQMLAKLPVSSSFWEEIIVPALGCTLDKSQAKKAIQKGLTSGNKVKELVEWVVQSSNMQNSFLKSLEQLVLADEDTVEEKAEGSEATAAASSAVDVAVAEESVGGSSEQAATNKGKRQKKDEEKKGKKASVSAADLIASTRMDEGDDDEEGMDSMLNFTIDTAGDRSVLESLEASGDVDGDDDSNFPSAMETELSKGSQQSGKKKKRDSIATSNRNSAAGQKRRGVDIDSEDVGLGSKKKTKSDSSNSVERSSGRKK
jgi:hypothetical protein